MHKVLKYILRRELKFLQWLSNLWEVIEQEYQGGYSKKVDPYFRQRKMEEFLISCILP